MNPPKTTNPSANDSVEAGKIAIVGLAGRFPGAANIHQFWANLCAGVEARTTFPDDVLAKQLPPALWQDPAYVKAGFVLDQVDQFDADFFEFTGRQAQITDPQQRLFLECVWEALEMAAIDVTRTEQLIGIYAGASQSTYATNDPSKFQESMVEALPWLIGNDKDYLATQTAYRLNLQGPCMTIQSACSTGLVATHVACQSLLNYECDVAIAGAVTVRLPQERGYRFEDGGILAADGHCRAFDAAATGTVFGNGVGVVILKRLADALADGDPIWAVIRGSAVNNDGARKFNFTTSSEMGQHSVISEAWGIAGVTPDMITYIETHGTGTQVGDPIEVGTLAALFGAEGTTEKFCAIGSVKTNVGHLESAAGITGLIKTVLALHHRQIPPSLNYITPNPEINFASMPLYVNAALTPWKTDRLPRCAGVSSFGIGGTNAHVVLEEAPPLSTPTTTADHPCHLLTLSAKNEAALSELAERYITFLGNVEPTALGNVCYTGHVGRAAFDYRLAVAGASPDMLQQHLAAYLADPAGNVGTITVGQRQDKRQVAFLFTGQGSQYVGMGQELYATQPVFRAVIDRCDAILGEELGRSLIELLYPATPPEHNDLLESHPCGQAVNFALECALTDLWRVWGIAPSAVLGHSLGDFAAAYCAGVLSVEDGLRLVIERGRLMEEALGSMVSVLAVEAEVAPLIAPFADVTIGVINGRASVVISGGHAHVAQATAALQQAGFKTRKLDIPVAAHSPMLDPVLARFEAAVRKVKLALPTCTVVSSMTGQIVTGELTDPVYWRNQLRNTVRFGDGVATLQQQACTIFLEIGPKPTLLAMVEQSQDQVTGWQGDEATGSHLRTFAPSHPVLLPSLREGQSDWQQMLTSLGALYVQGVAIDWQSFHQGYPRRKVTLPTYPFQRQRYWVDVAKPRPRAALRPLIDKLTQSPLLQELLFETEFSLAALPFLVDHRVYGAVVSPGACQLALTLNAAALALRQEHSLLVDEVVWPQPLVMPAAQKRTVQALLRPEAANGHGPHYRVQLVSFAADEAISSTTSTSTHLTGRVMAEASRPDAVVDLATLRQRCTHALDVAAFYNQLDAAQIALGPSFRWIQSLWRTPKQAETSVGQEVLAHFSCPEAIQLSGHLLHPGLLDACFQMTGAVPTNTEAAETLLPFALDAFHLHQPSTARKSQAATGNRWWCHATQVGYKQRWDIQLLTESGEIVATLTGFSVRPAPAEAIQGQEHWRNWLYTVAWEAQALPPAIAQERQALAGQRWLLFADHQGVGAALATQLRQSGATPVLVYADATMTQPWTQVDSATYHLQPAQAEHYASLLTEITNQAKVQGVVHLWSLDAPAVEQAADLETAARLGCGTVLPLVQALARQDGQAPHLWLVTQGAQPVLPGDTVAGLAQSTLWGMGKAIALEHPELTPVCLDLDGMVEQANDFAATANQLLVEMRATPTQQHETQIAWRGMQRYVARLALSAAPIATPFAAANGSQPTTHQTLVIHKAASYLITGGLGGLGLEVAKWLAAQGAGHLVLLGRSRPTQAAQIQVDALRAQGVTVTVAQADVTDQSQVEEVLTHIDPAYPLRGIVHAAGLLDDGVLLHQSWERFANVLPAKVQGAWHLHKATSHLSLDFFVLFSSTASLLGNRGQANYAAANAFLDAFAHYRHAQGLPALSINWGGWSAIGLAAARIRRNQQQWAAQGDGSISPSQGIAAFAHLLCENAPQVGVVPINWSRYLEGACTRSSFYQHLQETPAFIGKEAAPLTLTLRKQLEQTDAAQAASLLLQHLQMITAKILGLRDTTLLDPGQGLLQMGLDSLMALELRNQLNRTLSAQLPATLVFDYPTLAKLQDFLLTELLRPPTTAAEPNIVMPANVTLPSETSAAVDDLSDDDLIAQINMRYRAAGNIR